MVLLQKSTPQAAGGGASDCPCLSLTLLSTAQTPLIGHQCCRTLTHGDNERGSSAIRRRLTHQGWHALPLGGYRQGPVFVKGRTAALKEARIKVFIPRGFPARRAAVTEQPPRWLVEKEREGGGTQEEKTVSQKDWTGHISLSPEPSVFRSFLQALY